MPDALRLPGRPKMPVAFFSVGAVLRLHHGAHAGKLVRVVACEVKVNARRLAEVFDMEPSWHAPNPSYRNVRVKHCYHIVRFGHRLRLLFPPETPCEHWGSQLHNLYRDMASLGVARQTARLFLKAANLECAGHPRDEAVVDAIATYFDDEKGKNPYRKRNKVASKQAQRLRSGPKPFQRQSIVGNFAAGVDGFRATVEPMRLDPVVRKHLEARFERAHDGQV